jgi:polyhydroxyalkanoate synthesis regulator phasin
VGPVALVDGSRSASIDDDPPRRGSVVNQAVQRYLEAASGLTNLTSSKAEQVVRQLVRSGEAAGDQMTDLVDDLLERQRKNREAISALVKSETTRAVRAMGLATSAEVERLQKQVADLKRELKAGGSTPGSAEAPATKTPSKKAAKKGASKKATAKKAAKKTTKKATKKATKKSTDTAAGSNSEQGSGTTTS